MPIIETYKIITSTNSFHHMPGKIIFKFKDTNSKITGNGEVTFITPRVNSPGGGSIKETSKMKNMLAKYTPKYTTIVQEWRFKDITLTDEQINELAYNNDNINAVTNPNSSEVRKMTTFIDFVVEHHGGKNGSGPEPGTGTAGN